MSKVPPRHISETIRFSHVCDIAERISRSTDIRSKEKILDRYYESFLRHRANYRAQRGISPEEPEDGSSSFYCVLRCLLPKEDKARKSYDLQTRRLGSIFVKVLQIPEGSEDAKKIKARSFVGRYEDYAAIVYEVLKVRCREDNSNFTLKEIHDMLDKVASEDVRCTEMVLTTLTEKASAYEQKWFIRLLLKSMNLALEGKRMFNILHPQAKDLFQRCSNLEKVCNLIANKNIPEPSVLQNLNLNLNSVIEPFQHIRPMLCERFPGNIEEIMATDVLYLERKMDGERFQLHFKEGFFKYISRNGIDYTHSFGKNFNEGSFTPLLKNIWPIGITSVILDGEMMIWDEQNSRFREKGENTDVKNLNGYRHWRPCFIVYDLLYLNGKSLLDMNYAQRNYKMQELIKEDQTVLEKMQPQKVTSVEEFLEMFQAAIDGKAEGVVLKKQSSKYLPGVRIGGGWYKDKADYIKGLTEEFDLIVMGGFYNQQRTYIEAFLMGVLEEKSEDHFEIFSVGKVLNILHQRANLNDLLRPHWLEVNREPPPSWFHYVAKSSEGRPDVWIEPQKSCILQIKAADLSPSGAFALRKSLHFPRIVAWRNDKVWKECMPLQEYNDLCNGSEGLKKLNKRKTNVEDFTVNRKRQKLTPAQKRRLAILSYEKRLNSDEVEKVSDLLEGFYVCVLSGSSKLNKTLENLKALAIENGAEIVENPLPNEPKCINIAGDESYRVKILKKSKRYDIVSVEWFLNVCKKQILKLTAKDMVSMTPILEEQFASRPQENDQNDDEQDDEEDEEKTDDDSPENDPYDDDTEDEIYVMQTQRVEREELQPYQKDDDVVLVTPEDVNEMLKNISLEELDSLDLKAKEDLEETLFGSTTSKLFQSCLALFLSDDCFSSMAKCYFLLNGGTCVNSFNDFTTQTNLNSKHIYVFYNPKHCDTNQIESSLESNVKLLEKLEAKILNLNWILESCETGKKQNDSKYVLISF